MKLILFAVMIELLRWCLLPRMGRRRKEYWKAECYFAGFTVYLPETL
jgi:hypothetical protein